MIWEVAIIGAGPIGIELAVALKQRGTSHVHLEAGQVGATMFCWPPQTRWFSSNDRIAIAGVPLQTVDQSKATREEYLRYLRSVVQQFGLAIRTYEPVASIRKEHEGFELITRPIAGEQRLRARRVVLATGGTARPRKLRVPGEDLPHVEHHLRDPHVYFQKRVLVVGGRNSAVEATLRLHQVGAQVALCYRRTRFDEASIKYWLYPELMGLIQSGQIEAHLGTLVDHITPKGAFLSACMPDSFAAQPDTLREVRADFVLVHVGYEADMSLARSAGVELRGASQSPAYDERTMETNVPGLYIAGTAIAGTQDKYRVFLENCHIHVDRIVAAITGEAPPEAPAPMAVPES